MRSRSVLVIVLSLAAVSGCSRPASSPASSPPTPSGFGMHHHPIDTSSPEAQRAFDEGFAFVFGFNHEEAVRSFQRAADLDPKSPMPHWGIAWAVGPNYNLDIDDPRAKQAFDEIARARTLAAGGAADERAYVQALAVRY